MGCSHLTSRNWVSSFRTSTHAYLFTSKITFLSIHVDAITLIGPLSAFRQMVNDPLKSEFECKDLGHARYILGLEINYTDRVIEISQCGYIEKLLVKYGMIDCHPVIIPLDPNTPLWKSEPGTEIGNINEYQSMIGSLMYAVIRTRPDPHTITVLSQFSTPSETHLQAANAPYDTLREPWIGSSSIQELRAIPRILCAIVTLPTAAASMIDDPIRAI